MARFDVSLHGFLLERIADSKRKINTLAPI